MKLLPDLRWFVNRSNAGSAVVVGPFLGVFIDVDEVGSFGEGREVAGLERVPHLLSVREVRF